MSYRIQNHLLMGGPGKVDVRSTPNVGGRMTPEYVVHHFTASRIDSSEQVAAWLSDPAAKASAHLIIPRDSKKPIIQLAPFNVVTWHAGKSFWNGINGLNKCSIGIEIENPGMLEVVAESHEGAVYRAWYGEKFFDGNKGVDIITACAPNDPIGGPKGWLAYTEFQIDAVTEISKLLKAEYGIKEIVGHSDIAPGRKFDPGPAWPLESIQALLGGRDEDGEEMFEATSSLNMRDRPGTDGRIVATIGKGDHVEFLNERDGDWWLVHYSRDVNQRTEETTGWAHSRWLRSV